MTANTPENLHARASKLIAAAAKAVDAQSHLTIAELHTRSARADLSILTDLAIARDALTRVIKRAELQRLRLLRKADRLTKGATHG